MGRTLNIRTSHTKMINSSGSVTFLTLVIPVPSVGHVDTVSHLIYAIGAVLVQNRGISRGLKG